MLVLKIKIGQRWKTRAEARNPSQKFERRLVVDIFSVNNIALDDVFSSRVFVEITFFPDKVLNIFYLGSPLILKLTETFHFKSS